MTIPRNHTRKIAAIRETITRATARSLSNDFAPIDIDIDKAFEELHTYRGTLVQNGTKYTIRIHSNRWIDLHTD